MQTIEAKEDAQEDRERVGPQHVLLAKTGDPGMIIGVVTNSEPSSLALLAAGVAGMAARRSRREHAK